MCKEHSVYLLWIPFFKHFFLKIYLFIWVHCSCLQMHQKRASDPITNGYEPPCGCWELNLGPLEEQPVLLTLELSLQAWVLGLKMCTPPAVVAHSFNPSTWEAEAGRFQSSRPAWSTKWVPEHPGLHRETLSRKKKFWLNLKHSILFTP